MNESLKRIKRGIYCGSIYWAKNPHHFGHQYAGLRPYLVVDTTEHLLTTAMVCVVPLTSKVHHQSQHDVLVRRDGTNGLTCDSLARLNYLYAFDKRQLGIYIGEVDRQIIQKIHQNLRSRFNL